MRPLLLAALLLAPAARALGPADETDAVWLVVINETGQHLTEVTLDYGSGRFHYQLFSSGLTHGGYAKVKDVQPMVLRYTDSEGSKHERKIDKPLLPAMIGGIVRLTLHKDGGVAYEFSMAAPAAHDPNVRDLRGTGPPWWVEWVLIGLLFPLGLWVVVKLVKLAVRFGAKAKEALSDPYREKLVAALGLKSVECPVPMYSRKSWWQGSYRGRMVGYDGTELWLGAIDEATRCVFQRDKAGVFQYKDYHSGDPVPGVPEPEFQRALSELSPAVAGVNVMTDAVQAELAGGGSPEVFLKEDLPRLEAMLASVTTGQAREEARWSTELRDALGLRLEPCPVAQCGAGSWQEGRYEGLRVGFLRNRLWFGEPEPAASARGGLYRDHTGAFQDGYRRKPWSREFLKELEELSPAVGAVTVFAGALEVFLDRRGQPKTLLAQDLPRLKNVLKASQEPA